jgi:hypothetical protein
MARPARKEESSSDSSSWAAFAFFVEVFIYRDDKIKILT